MNNPISDESKLTIEWQYDGNTYRETETNKRVVRSSGYTEREWQSSLDKSRISLPPTQPYILSMHDFNQYVEVEEGEQLLSEDMPISFRIVRNKR